jgi:hypothetical protein
LAIGSLCLGVCTHWDPIDGGESASVAPQMQRARQQHVEDCKRDGVSTGGERD